VADACISEFCTKEIFLGITGKKNNVELRVARLTVYKRYIKSAVKCSLRPFTFRYQHSAVKAVIRVMPKVFPVAYSSRVEVIFLARVHLCSLAMWLGISSVCCLFIYIIMVTLVMYLATVLTYPLLYNT